MSDVPRSELWHGHRLVAEDLAPGDLLDALREPEPDTRAWWCLPRRRGPELQRTAEAFGLDALAVDDIVGPREAPKLDTVGDTMLLVAAAVDFDPVTAELRVHRVSLLATTHALALLADGPVATDVIARLETCGDRLAGEGIAAGVHAVLDLLVDGYTTALDDLETATDQLTSQLFTDRPLSRDDQVRAFQLRQALAALRRVCSPMQDVTAELANAARRPEEGAAADPVDRLLGTATARRFADVADHARHAADGTAALRDVLTSAFETNLALADVHLNTIMRKLSAYAALIAVPTLITGFMGMNVPFWGFQHDAGFAAAVIVIVVAVVLLYGAFRRSGWL